MSYGNITEIPIYGGVHILHVIEYFATENQEYWLSKIAESDWRAGQFLYALLKDNKFHEYTDEKARVLLLVDENSLVSFCTLSDKDDIETTDLMPWIGFVYTFPQYRGNRFVANLLSCAADLARKTDLAKSMFQQTRKVFTKSICLNFLKL